MWKGKTHKKVFYSGRTNKDWVSLSKGGFRGGYLHPPPLTDSGGGGGW